MASIEGASRSEGAMRPGHDIGGWRWMRQGRAAGARGRTAVRGVVVWGLVLAIAGVGALPGVPLGRVPLEGCGGGRRCVENRGLGCASEGRTFGGCPSGGGVAGMMHERAQGIRGPLRGGAADVGGAGGDSGAGKKDDGAVRRFGFGGRVPSLQGFHRKFDKKKKKAGKSFAVRERLWASFTDVFTALAALEQAPGSLMKSKTEEKAVLMRSIWRGFLPVMAYACSSIYMVISQAYVLRHKDANGVNFSTLLLTYQNICGIALYFPADVCGFQTFKFFDWRSAWIMLPNSALFAIMVYSSAQAIRTLSVPMMSVLRNFAPITITLLEWAFHKRKPSSAVLLSMGLLILGALVGAKNDMTFSREGYLWMLTNVVANVSHLLVLRKLKLNRDLSNTQILHYSALWSLIWLIPVGYLEGVGASMRRLRTMPTPFLLVAFSTGVNSIFMFLATIWCLERTSGSTYSMVGALNKIPIAICGYLFFSEHPSSPMGLAGIVIGLCGGIVFTLAKLHEMQAWHREKEDRNSDKETHVSLAGNTPKP